ncbi:MAG: hypothetical protein ACOYOJ_11190 [Alsobacter sp.]
MSTATHATLIEIHGDAVGIVAPARRGFVFYAAAQPFFAIEGQVFRSARHAEAAARQLLRKRDAAALARS